MPADHLDPRERAATIHARLDRLPTTRYHWTLLLMLSLGGAFEFYDLFLMGYIGPGLVRSGLFTSGSATFFGMSGLAAFVAATFTGLFVGTLAFGFTADRFGRRTVFTYSLLWYTAATCVMAFQTTTSGVLLWRAVTGVGIGVELVTIDTYIAELMPKHLRAGLRHQSGRAILGRAACGVCRLASGPASAARSRWLAVGRAPRIGERDARVVHPSRHSRESEMAHRPRQVRRGGTRDHLDGAAGGPRIGRGAAAA